MHKFGDTVDYDVVNSPEKYIGIVAYNRSKLAQVGSTGSRRSKGFRL